jgi:hypothetical protein
VTLVLTVHSRDAFWVVADRRLSYPGGRRPVDDAIKLMILETLDGVGVLAYAGLGATSRGIQPSEWMSAVLRGRSGLTFEQALGTLSTVANRELPRHLLQLPGKKAHFIVAAAFIRGEGARIFSIDHGYVHGTGLIYRFVKHQRTDLPGSPPPRAYVTGTGGLYLARQGRDWRRRLYGLANAYDRGKVSAGVIADELAKLNLEASQHVGDGTVGPRSIVVWRRRPGARAMGSGGGHFFYDGARRDPESVAIPSIGNGLDLAAFFAVLVKTFEDAVDSGVDPAVAAIEPDWDERSRLLGELPSDPDESLR